MAKKEDKDYSNFESFEQFFHQAEDRMGYWVERAKLDFTEEVISRMKQIELTRSHLAERMEVQPGFVTRLLSGRNNFELATMVRLARALDCDYRSHLQPHGTISQWINFLKEEPVRPGPEAPVSWGSEGFTNFVTIPANPTPNEPIRASA
jgi:transcriptional regulator with XRE-family HTH domain